MKTANTWSKTTTATKISLLVINSLISDHQGPDFDSMSYLFPCEIDDAIQYINLGCKEISAKTIKVVWTLIPNE